MVATAVSELARELHRIGAIRFGDFELKDGRRSPFYLDLRVLVSYPTSLARVGRALAKVAERLRFDRIGGIPYAGLPISVAMSLVAQQPLIYPRKETKDYGTKKMIEGEFNKGETVLVVDDVITSGGAKLEAIEQLRAVGLRVEDVLVVIDRSRPGGSAIEEAGLRLHSVIKVLPLLEVLCDEGLITANQRERGVDFVGHESTQG